MFVDDDDNNDESVMGGEALSSLKGESLTPKNQHIWDLVDDALNIDNVTWYSW